MGTTHFGKEYAGEIADIISKYTKYNLLRKAEVQLPDVFSIVNYHEADRMLAAWKELTVKAEELEHKLSPSQRCLLSTGTLSGESLCRSG